MFRVLVAYGLFLKRIDLGNNKSRDTTFFTTVDMIYCDWCIIKVVLVVDIVESILLQSQQTMLTVVKKSCVYSITL